MRFLRSVAALSVLLTSAVQATEHCPPAGDANPKPEFDAALLKEGRFTYRTTLQGKSLGDTVIEIRRVDSAYRITMNAVEIAQSWEATFRRSFEPLTAHLRMRAHGEPYEMSLNYDGTKIHGEEHKADATIPVSAIGNGVIIDQRVDWASMMAVKGEKGSSVTMKVFDPSTGFSPMLGRIGEGTDSTVRLDYSICKREHVENYTVFATEAAPRTMLREDMPNGLVTELIRVEP